jgi:hypothetical protein
MPLARGLSEIDPDRLCRPGSTKGRPPLGSKRKTILAQHSNYGLGNPRFSPDRRWIAFHAAPGTVTRQMFVALVRTDGAPSPEADWIPIN